MLRGDITVAIRHAVMNELAEVGYGRLSIEAVARRAGVGKTAIYRRWNNKLEMVLEIVSDVAGRAVPLGQLLERQAAERNCDRRWGHGEALRSGRSAAFRGPRDCAG